LVVDRLQFDIPRPDIRHYQDWVRSAKNPGKGAIWSEAKNGRDPLIPASKKCNTLFSLMEFGFVLPNPAALTKSPVAFFEILSFKRIYSPFIAINALQSAQIFGQRFLGAAAIGRFENLLSNSTPNISDRLGLIFRYRRQPGFLFGITVCTKVLRELFD
jgi:hypothetical protein